MEAGKRFYPVLVSPLPDTPQPHILGGGRVVQRCWVNFLCRGVPVGQGPTALAVGAGGVVWTFLLSSILSLLFLPLFGRRPNID